MYGTSFVVVDPHIVCETLLRRGEWAAAEPARHDDGLYDDLPCPPDAYCGERVGDVDADGVTDRIVSYGMFDGSSSGLSVSASRHTVTPLSFDDLVPDGDPLRAASGGGPVFGRLIGVAPIDDVPGDDIAVSYGSTIRLYRADSGIESGYGPGDRSPLNLAVDQGAYSYGGFLCPDLDGDGQRDLVVAHLDADFATFPLVYRGVETTYRWDGGLPVEAGRRQLTHVSDPTSLSVRPPDYADYAGIDCPGLDTSS